MTNDLPPVSRSRPVYEGSSGSLAGAGQWHHAAADHALEQEQILDRATPVVREQAELARQPADDPPWSRPERRRQRGSPVAALALVVARLVFAAFVVTAFGKPGFLLRPVQTGQTGQALCPSKVRSTRARSDWGQGAV